MKMLSARAQRIMLVIALFAVSFALYAASESGSWQLETVLLGLLAGMMVLAILIN